MSSNKGGTRRHRGVGDGLDELDALVRAELLALGGERPRPGEREGRPRRVAGALRARDNVLLSDAWDRAQARGCEARRHADDCCGGDEDPYDAAVMGLAEDEPLLDFADAFEGAPIADEDDRFTLEERHFIERAVNWLEPRANKDVIVNRIWTRLTDTAPTDFYGAEIGGPAQRPEAPTENAARTEPGRAPRDSARPRSRPRLKSGRSTVTRLHPAPAGGAANPPLEARAPEAPVSAPAVGRSPASRPAADLGPEPGRGPGVPERPDPQGETPGRDGCADTTLTPNRQDDDGRAV